MSGEVVPELAWHMGRPVRYCYVLGDPFDEATTLGPMVETESAFARRQVTEAVRGGAKALIGVPRRNPGLLSDNGERGIAARGNEVGWRPQF
jgi:hypothetical protein